MMEKKIFVIAGTYTEKESKGIYIYDFNPSNEEINLHSVFEISNPSYIISNRNKRRIYSVTQNESGSSYANAFAYDSCNGILKLINRSETKGEGSCHIAIDFNEKFVVTADYGGGSISILPINNDGSLAKLSQSVIFSGTGKHPKRQEASHPHCSVFSPDKKYLFVTDLGTDSIYRFDIDYTSGNTYLILDSRKDFSVNAGSGPRHLIYNSSGKYLYLVTELSGTIIVYEYCDGDLKMIQEIPIYYLPVEGGGGITLSPDGKRLYVSMREGNDGIGVFDVAGNGLLTRIGYFKVSEHPRDIAISPDGNYLLIAAMKDDKMELLRITEEGELQNTGKTVNINMPASVNFLEFDV